MRSALLALVAVSVGSTALAAQQAGAPPAAPKPRRSVEIRSQAPAPEVITVRPRDVPAYTRRLLVPTLLHPDSTPARRRGSVVVPAPASAEARAATSAPNSDQRPRTP